MANGVSSNVRSIIDSFLNGLDVLTKLQDKQKRRKLRSKAHDEQHAAPLKQSLRRGPHDIDLEYRRGFDHLGEQYSRGDGIAQSSLAEVLLRLNTGLVSIIASFLENDSRGKVVVDYASLTSLSELSRRDSLYALRGLYQRVSSRRIPAQVNSSRDRRPDRERSSAPIPIKYTKIKKPTIARVTIEDSSRRAQLAVVKPGAKRKSPTSSSTNLSKAKSYSTAVTAIGPTNPRSKSSSNLSSAKTLSRSPSSTVLGGRSHVSAIRSTPDLLSARSPSQAPPLPTQHTDPIRQQPFQRPGALPRRQTAPTLRSIMSDNTKIGEIPPDRWAVPFDADAASALNRQALQSGWPLRDVDGNTVYKPKKRRFLGLFRRKSDAA